MNHDTFIRKDAPLYMQPAELDYWRDKQAPRTYNAILADSPRENRWLQAVDHNSNARPATEGPLCWLPVPMV